LLCNNDGNVSHSGFKKQVDDHSVQVQTEQHLPKNAELVLIVLTAGKNSTLQRDKFGFVLSGLSNLRIKFPDLLILYEDWGADPAYAHAISSGKYNFSFPVDVVPRPHPNEADEFYPAHYYRGHLRMFWWYAMNNAFSDTGAHQVCYLEDDIVLYPYFFAWLEETRATLAAANGNNSINTHWGVVGSGSNQYAPLCVTRPEWSILLHFYQHFCWKEQMAWDMVLFGLHQHGPLPALRIVSYVQFAVHIGYKGNSSEIESFISNLEKEMNTDLVGSGYHTHTPYYGGEKKKEKQRFVDLNYDVPGNKGNRPDTNTQLWKIIDSCVNVALDSKKKMSVDKKLTIDGSFKKIANMDIRGHDISQLKISYHEPSRAEAICIKNMDCFGFVNFNGVSWLKVNATMDDAIGRNGALLYQKECSRTSLGRCVPMFKYTGNISNNSSA